MVIKEAPFLIGLVWGLNRQMKKQILKQHLKVRYFLVKAKRKEKRAAHTLQIRV